MSTPDPVARLTPPRLSLASCVRPLHDLLDESWQAMARDGAFDGVLGDWVRRLGAQAAAAGVGRSVAPDLWSQPRRNPARRPGR